jgi:hypothetical protein
MSVNVLGAFCKLSAPALLAKAVSAEAAWLIKAKPNAAIAGTMINAIFMMRPTPSFAQTFVAGIRGEALRQYSLPGKHYVKSWRAIRLKPSSSRQMSGNTGSERMA